jgi:hypothetical protein
MVRVFAVKSLLPVAGCDDDLKSKVVKTNRTTVSAPPPSMQRIGRVVTASFSIGARLRPASWFRQMREASVGQMQLSIVQRGPDYHCRW